MEDHQVFAVVGEGGFERLVGQFYRQVPGDPILGPMYERRDLRAAEARLRDFLVGRFGGPQRYIEQRGHPRLRMRHSPFSVTPSARDRWLVLMDRALHQAQLDPAAEEVLRAFFQSTADFLVNRAADT